MKIKAIEEHGRKLIKSSSKKCFLTLLKQKEIFDRFTKERMAKIQTLGEQINCSNLIYYLKGKSGPKYFIGFKGPLGLLNNMKNSYINIKKAKEN